MMLRLWCVLVLSLASTAGAATVYVNDSRLAIFEPNQSDLASHSSVAGAKFLLPKDNNSFDMSLDAGGGTNGNNFIGAPLGRNSYLSGRAFDFTLSNHAGEGLIFTLTSAGTSTSLSFGTFNSVTAPTGPGSVAVTAMGNGKTPGSAYNAILLESFVMLDGASMSVADLQFTIDPAVAVVTSGLVDTITTSTNRSNLQFIGGDVNLAQLDWQLSGTLLGVRPASMATSGANEGVKFTVNLKQFDGSIAPALDGFTAIPEPTAVVALPLALALVRRRTSRTVAR
jgi:hypothetical protein